MNIFSPLKDGNFRLSLESCHTVMVIWAWKIVIMKHQSQALYSQHNSLLPDHFGASFCRNSDIAEIEFLGRTKELTSTFLVTFGLFWTKMLNNPFFLLINKLEFSWLKFQTSFYYNSYFYLFNGYHVEVVIKLQDLGLCSLNHFLEVNQLIVFAALMVMMFSLHPRLPLNYNCFSNFSKIKRSFSEH